MRAFRDALRELFEQPPLMIAGELLAAIAFGAAIWLLLSVGAAL